MGLPQMVEASKQTDANSKRHALALVLKLRKRANKTTKGRVRACPQIKEASKQIDVTSKRHAMVLVLKLRMRANLTPKGHVRWLVHKLKMQANK